MHAAKTNTDEETETTNEKDMGIVNENANESANEAMTAKETPESPMGIEAKDAVDAAPATESARAAEVSAETKDEDEALPEFVLNDADAAKLGAVQEGPAIDEPPTHEHPRPSFEVSESKSAATPKAPVEEVEEEVIPEPVEEPVATPIEVQSGLFGVVELLLKDRVQLYERLKDRDQLTQMLPGLLLVALFCSGLVGGILGTYSGGWQILYVSLKLPLLLLLTLVVCYAAFWVWGLYFRTQIKAEQVAALTLASIATTGLLLLGLSPLLWLALGGGVAEMKLQNLSLLAQESQYHRAILTLVVSFGLAAVGGIHVLYQGIRTIASTPQEPRLGGARLLASVWIGMYGFVGLQMAWILRPYLFHPWAKGRPLTFVRSLDGSVYESVIKTMLSVLGLGA